MISPAAFWRAGFSRFVCVRRMRSRSNSCCCFQARSTWARCLWMPMAPNPGSLGGFLEVLMAQPSQSLVVKCHQLHRHMTAQPNIVTKMNQLRQAKMWQDKIREPGKTADTAANVRVTLLHAASIISRTRMRIL